MEGYIIIAISLILNIAGFSFWLGKLSQKLTHLCNDVSHIKKDIKDVSEEVKEHSQRITKLEVKSSSTN